MALPNAVEDELGRIVTITWLKEGTTTPEILTGATITGIIETLPGPTYTRRAIAGMLTVTVGASGIFTWTLAAADTITAGKYTVQFVATFSASNILRSIPVPWTVIRSLVAS